MTRAEPGATSTAERLRGLGFDPLIAPLLRLAPITGADLALDGVGALAFTSANGVAAFADLSPERRLPVFAVGAATAAAARARGFRSVASADGDVEALRRMILAHSPPIVGAVLHPGPAEPAGDLAGGLAAGGVAARAVAVYQTLAGPPDAAPAAEIRSLDAVLLHSPKAARALAAHLAACPAPHLAAVCLSPAVAAPLTNAGMAAVHVADSPDEAALMECLRRALGLASRPNLAAETGTPEAEARTSEAAPRRVARAAASAEGDEDFRPNLLSRSYWIMMAFAALCILSAVVLVQVAPRLAHSPPALGAPAKGR